MEPGQDGDVELHEGKCWDVGLCTSVGGNGSVGSSTGEDGTDGVGVVRVLAMVVAAVIV